MTNREITQGDLMYTYGGFGAGIDYTVRLCIRLKDPVDGGILDEALLDTSKRYPYLSLRMRKDANRLFYEENRERIVLFHTDKKITLNAPESNYHVWAVCYSDDVIMLDFYHGIADGTGMYMVLSTLLYCYCSRKYGVSDHIGVRIPGEEIVPEEIADPMDLMPDIDMSDAPDHTIETNSFSAGHGDVSYVTDIELDEDGFMKFCVEHDASPGVMLSLLFARGIDALFPQRDRDIVGSYILNARPMLGAELTHHNCVHTVVLNYSDKVKVKPLEQQAMLYRGMTFAQTEEERVKQTMLVFANRRRMNMKEYAVLPARLAYFGGALKYIRNTFTYLVSYVGKWQYEAVAPYVTEFWTHIPPAVDIMAEIAAIRGSVFLTFHRTFENDQIIGAIMEELKSNGVEGSVKRTMVNDNAAFSMPE